MDGIPLPVLESCLCDGNIPISEAAIKLCEFHREKNWKEWCSKISHGVADNQQAVRTMLRRIAHAKTQVECDLALHALKTSQPWQSSQHLRNYFTITWEPYLQVRM